MCTDLFVIFSTGFPLDITLSIKKILKIYFCCQDTLFTKDKKALYTDLIVATVVFNALYINLF